GPQRPASLTKRAAAPVDVGSVQNMLLTKVERAARSNVLEATAVIKSIHAQGSSRSLPDGTGLQKVTTPRGVRMLKEAHRHRHGFSPHSHVEINSIELPLRKRAGNRLVKAGKFIYEFDNKGAVVAKRLSKDMGVADNVRPSGPQSSNGMWDDARVDDGGECNWGVDELGDVRPTVVGGFQIGAPRSDYEAAVLAIKRDLQKPKRLKFGGIKGSADRDDMDMDMDMDDKDPNADDAFDTDPNAMRQRRGKAGI